MMTKESLYREAADILTDEGWEAEVYEDYSGRGMYGKTTVGIVTSASQAEVTYAVIFAVLQNKEEGQDTEDSLLEAKKMLPMKSDNMATDYIYY